MTFERPIVAPAEPVRHKITVAEFLALEEAGFFEDQRVELVDGEIFRMAALHHPHARAQMILSTAIDLAVEALGGDWQALAPISAELDATSLPEADIIVAYRPGDRFATPETVRLLVEISFTSLQHDLGPKLRLYARSGVPEYWVADIKERQIIRFHAPEGEAYRERAVFAFGVPVPSATIDGLTVDTSRLA